MCARNRPTRVCSALALLCGVTLLCTMFSATASAQPRDRKTTVTFSQPFEIPGVGPQGSGPQVLPAGTYVFTLVDSLSDRHIVRVFSSDEKQVHATILAVPNYRLRATDKTVITFSERAAGDPQAIRAWFYPGDNSGQEFVYPKRRAVELAKVTNQPVLYIPDEFAVQIMAPVKSASEPPPVALRVVPLRAVTPRGEDVSIAQVVEPPPVQVARLPKTAGTLPLFGLMGVLFMAVGLALKRARA
jgi:hypothetical protein